MPRSGDTRLLENIPCDVLGQVFCNWLDMNSLTRIDSAVCSHEARPRLLKIFASNLFDKLCDLGSNERSVEWYAKRKIQLSRVQIDEPSYELSKYLRLFSKSIRYVHCRNNDSIDLVAESCRNLESFVCTKLAMKLNLNAVLDLNANLQELRLESVKDLAVKHFQDLSLPQLYLLSLRDTVCDDALLATVIRTTEALQHIEIGGCCHITDAGLIYLAQHCPLLYSIGLEKLRMSDSALERLVELCPNIEDLDLSHNAVLTDAGVHAVVTRLKTLRRIGLCNCTKLTDISLEHLARFVGKSLQWLHIVQWPQVRVNVLVHLLQQCDKLHTLVLDCDIDSYCADVVPHMHNLQYLSVFGILSDECLCLIAQHCKQLKTLSIPCSYKVHRNLASRMHQLAVSTEVDDARVMQCADVKVQKGDLKYTEKGFLALMEGLPNLRVLDGSVVSCDSKDSRAPACWMVQTMWQRLRPGIQFEQRETPVKFDVLEMHNR